MAALSSILAQSSRWELWGFPEETKVVLMGHSNGGQGTWYVAERYPDRVVAGELVVGFYLAKQLTFD